MVCIQLFIFVSVSTALVTGARDDKIHNGKIGPHDNDANNLEGRGGVKFDEKWFEESCDLSEWKKGLFLGPEYQLSEDVETDNAKWEGPKKCDNTGDGRDPVIIPGIQDKYECATTCSHQSNQNAGTVVCCEFHQDKSQCEIRIGWQSISDSDYGADMRNVKNWFGKRNEKLARLFYTDVTGGSASDVPMQGGEAVKKADEGRLKMRDLVTQVNHMSIDGILDHMLSFYICMRWVPDEEFVKVAQFELEHTSVDEVTPRTGSAVSREHVIEQFLTSGVIPVRCNTAMHVQHGHLITELSNSLDDSTSAMNEVVRFSQEVNEAGHKAHIVNLTKMSTRVEAVKEAMHFEDGKESVYVKDLRAKARRPDVLPWSGFLRPSNKFTHHVSEPDNLFMLCFGPRTASFPHKRDGGGHFLADQNMAGCNGFWSVASLKDQLERIRKLFAPEMCFEYKLRRELKQQFMSTFISMNQAFEQAMAGTYTKHLHDLDPTNSLKLDLLSERKTKFKSDMKSENASYTNKKYERFAGMVAGGASKWIVCKAHENVGSEAFGTSDNFFRNPKAYEKWIGDLGEENVPECKTLDTATGCVKCAIAVKNDNNCHIRLDVKLKDIFRAIREKQDPFLDSRYQVEEEVTVEDKFGRHKEIQIKDKRGACLVRKDGAAYHDRGEEALKEAYFGINPLHTIVRLEDSYEPKDGGMITSAYRFKVKQRQRKVKEREEWMGAQAEAGGSFQKLLDGVTGGSFPDVPESILNQTAAAMSFERYKDTPEDFAKKFIFTHSVPFDQNRPAHKVDYFVSCPCSRTDFYPNSFFDSVGSQGMAEYYNR